QKAALAFAQCIRDNGVRDFPDPAKTEPLVDTNRIPSAGTPGGSEHSECRDAEVRPVRIRGRRTGEQVMRTTWVVAAAVVLVAAVAIGGVVATSGGGPATPAAQASAVNTATVDRGRLSDMVSQYGILTYRARSDGSPYAVINRAGGTYTKLPNPVDRVGCGAVLYRVNNHPVLLLCGSTPAYRSAAAGDRGPDVAALPA